MGRRVEGRAPVVSSSSFEESRGARRGKPGHGLFSQHFRAARVCWLHRRQARGSVIPLVQRRGLDSGRTAPPAFRAARLLVAAPFILHLFFFFFGPTPAAMAALQSYCK